ncbi:FG-GAP and VCBS repeat-containing protein [Streptomyces sp. NPDC101132]|uniref:FG-GAP and VCBS repeat-containing protein n=1 Tax=Streptomyces sp. NPDC101132 TaxID=3366110 RepID=UPI0037F59016
MRRHTRHAVAVAAAATALTGGLLVSAGTQAQAATTAGPAATRYSDDFNGDGYHDLAVAVGSANVVVPETAEKPNAGWGAGYVTVSYGGKYGAQKTGLKAITQDTPGVPGKAALNHGFGQVIANGDLDGDGYADLVVRSEDWVGGPDGKDTARVTVLWGGPTGLKGGSDIANNDPDLKFGAFGGVLVTGDFTGDGKTDLVVGHSNRLDLFKGPFTRTGKPAAILPVDDGIDFRYSPYEPGRIAAGRIDKDAADDLVVLGDRTLLGERPGKVLLGGPKGLKATSAKVRTGTSAVIADFDKDGYGDVAVGHPDHNWEDLTQAGRVHIAYGGSGGLDAGRRVRVITEDTVGVPGSPQRRDQFGSDVRAADINGDGYPDLVVGASGEKSPLCDDGCRNRSGGGLYVFKGGKSGVVAAGSAFYDYASEGVLKPGGIVRFGDQLKPVDLNGDRKPELNLTWSGGTIWSVGVKNGVVGAAPTREVRPVSDPRIESWGNRFGLMTR